MIFIFNVEFFSTFREKHTVFVALWHTIGHLKSNNVIIIIIDDRRFLNIQYAGHANNDLDATPANYTSPCSSQRDIGHSAEPIHHSVLSSRSAN